MAKTPRKKNGSIDWDDLYGKGENPNGTIAQTSNETVRNCDAMPPQDYHYHQSADGERWNDGFQNKVDYFGTPAPTTVGRSRKRR
jgi:hypothetical protein